MNKPMWQDIDKVTRSRVGELSAYGLVDTQIADILLISLEQIASIKECEDFRAAQAKVLSERARRSIDLSDGWDGIEERALTAVYQSLEYNRDPTFALAAAKIANQAKRNTPAQQQQTIDASKVGTTVILNMNKIYVDKSTENNSLNIVTGDYTKQIPQKRLDLLSPKSVHELLKPLDITAPIDDLRVEVLGIALEKAGVKLDD